jgi:hypothetical protein
VLEQIAAQVRDLEIAIGSGFGMTYRLMGVAEQFEQVREL